MRITVNVPDRYIAVDGLSVTYAGAPVADDVHTLQYDTGVLEGMVTYIDQRSEGLKDPAAVADWLKLWGEALNGRLHAMAAEVDAAAGRYAEWQITETARVAEFDRQQEETRKAAEAAAVASRAEEDARVEAKVREVIKQIAAGGQPA